LKYNHIVHAVPHHTQSKQFLKNDNVSYHLTVCANRRGIYKQNLSSYKAYLNNDLIFKQVNRPTVIPNPCLKMAFPRAFLALYTINLLFFLLPKFENGFSITKFSQHIYDLKSIALFQKFTMHSSFVTPTGSLHLNLRDQIEICH